MKKFVIAAALLVAGASAASAQAGWMQGKHPYAKHRHSECQMKSKRLYGYEMRAKADGRLTRSERQTMKYLERDLDRSCGRYRWSH